MKHKGDLMSDPLLIIVSKDEILAEDVSPALNTLKTLTSSPAMAQKYRENVDLSFSGYDSHPSEVFEIPEIRNYVQKLDGQFPFWLYFLSKKFLGLQALILCLLPPVNEEAKKRIYPEMVNDLLNKRWFPALNQIGDFVGMSEIENKAITERAIRYITDGPLRIKGTV